MSRTYRQTWATEYYGNLEAYEKNNRKHWIILRREEHRFFGVDDVMQYYKNFRDGQVKESNRNRGYKKDTNKIIRAKNKRDIVKLLKYDDYHEEFIPANKKNGKFLLWCYW